jgi:hypothetical protein
MISLVRLIAVGNGKRQVQRFERFVSSFLGSAFQKSDKCYFTLVFSRVVRIYLDRIVQS